MSFRSFAAQMTAVDMGSHAANASELPDTPWHACHVTKLQWMVKLRVHNAAEWQVLWKRLKRPGQPAPPKLLKIPRYSTFGRSLLITQSTRAQNSCCKGKAQSDCLHYHGSDPCPNTTYKDLQRFQRLKPSALIGFK